MEFKQWLEDVDQQVQDLIAKFSNMYPVAGPIVDGNVVREQIPNMGSISASLDDYEILPKVRVFPIYDFAGCSSYSYSSGLRKCKELIEQIKYNKELNPLIIVEEKNGPYVLEGSHRMSACVDLGLKEVPALIVLDIESLLENVNEYNNPRKGMKSRWSVGYKKSIDCSNPKGFSQKNYCNRKKRGGKYKS